MIDFDELFQTNPFMRYFMKMPVFINFGMLFGMNFSFIGICLFCLSKTMNIILLFLTCSIHEVVFVLVVLSLYRAFTNDPGYVSRTLKHERSDLFIQAKMEYDQEEMRHNEKHDKARKHTTQDAELTDISFDIESHSLVKTEQLPIENDGEMKSKSEKKEGKRQQRINRMVKFNYCKKCDNLQPPRADHCGLCGRCVLRMDHHCPWIGNCVGYGTHKNFALFIFYTAFCGAIQSMIYFYGWFNQSFGNMQKDKLPILALVCTMMALMGCFTLIFFGIFTIFLIMRNLLSSEMSSLSNPFDQHIFNKPILENIKDLKVTKSSCKTKREFIKLFFKKCPLTLLFHRLRIIMELAIDTRYQGFLRDVEMLSNFKYRLFEAYSKWHYSRVNEIEEQEKEKEKEKLKNNNRNSKANVKKDDIGKPNKALTKSEIKLRNEIAASVFDIEQRIKFFIHNYSNNLV